MVEYRRFGPTGLTVSALGFLEWALSAEEMRRIDELFVDHGVDAYPNQGMNP